MRFPEFTKEWEEHALAEYLDFKNGLNPDVKRIGRGLPFISVMDILADGTINYDSIRGKVEATEREIENFSVEKGDILFQRSSETLEDVGRANVYMDNRTAVYGGFVIRGRKIGDYNPLFFKYLLSTPLARKRTCRMGAGAQHFNIGQDGLSKISLCFPLMEEQNKIARLLSLIDERIATQNKIIEKLQSLIKGLVDSLLENPSWEKVYLRSFMQFYSTNSLSWEQLSYSNGNVRNLHYGLIHGFQTSMIDSTLLPRILPNYQPKQYTVCQDGDVAFADASEDTNEIGKAIEFSNTIDVKTVCGLHTIHGRDIKQNTILGFKGFAFNSRYFHDQVRRLAQGTKVYSITAKNLSSCYVYIPDMIKQENVVRLLNAYEENLSLNRTLLNKYEIQKQYLLQQMLI